MLTQKINHLIGGLSLAMLLHGNFAQAQQIPYSQYLHTPMFTNPAEVAAGNARQAVLNYRRQGSGQEDLISSAAVSYTQPFVSRNNGLTWGGLGVSVVTEQAGYMGMLKNNGLMAGYAHTVHLSQKVTMSAGLGFGVFQKGIDMSQITTSSQYYNGSYNPGASQGEGADKAFLGVSVFNANRPNIAIFTDQDRLPANLIVHGGYEIYNKSRIALMPTFRHMAQSSASQTNLGVLTSYLLSNNSGTLKSGSLGLGTWYSVNRAAIVSLEITQPNYFIRFSYDLPVTEKVASRQINNAVELSIGWKKDIKRNIPKKPVVLAEEVIEKVAEAQPKPMPAVAPKPVEVALKPVIVPVAEIQPQTIREKLTDEERKLFTSRLTFEFKSSKLTPASEQLVNDMLKVLKKYPEMQIEVAGYTDNVGSQEANQKISLARAESIRQQMLKGGIPADRIKTFGYGPANPIASNATEEGRKENRRAQFRLIE
jgi:type IX secretion system PorP/SprF family membrane protein